VKISQGVERTNYLWVIALLLLILSYVILRLPAGSLVRDFISFAASIASLVLAVVAIFYSIISSERFHQSIASLTDSATLVSEEAKRLEETSSEFNRRADELVAEIKLVPVSVRENFAELGGKVETLMSSSPKGEKSSRTGSAAKRRNVVAVTIAFYVVVLAAKTGKAVDLQKLGVDEAIKNILFGYFLALRQFKPCDIDMDGAGYVFQVSSAGDLDADSVTESIERNKDDFVKRTKNQIDLYFGVTTDEHKDDTSEGEDHAGEAHEPVSEPDSDPANP
jgi:hypothetical protein